MKDIIERAKKGGLNITKWNVSTLLGRTKGKAIHTSDGWEITDAGKQHLRNLGISRISPAAVEVAVELRAYLEKIKDDEIRAFAEEAIKCYEAQLYRSAIVMSWMAAMGVLHQHVIKKHLKDFNAEASRVDPKWKPAKTADDLGNMKEANFLDRLVAISVIGKNVKKELQNCLDRRNGCGHPSSLKIGAHTVAHHIEVLLLNVFQKFG